MTMRSKGHTGTMAHMKRRCGGLMQSNLFWLVVLATCSFASAFYGFSTYAHPADHSVWTTAYITLQLFFVEMNLPDSANGYVHPALQIGRFGALVTSAWAIVIAVFPQARVLLTRMLRSKSKSCAVVLGYGPVGQAIAAGLRRREHAIAFITAVHSAATPELVARAKRDKVLLIEGDPSDPDILLAANVQRAKQVYISDPDDLVSIDRAVAVRDYIGSAASDIRVVLNDGAIGRQMAEASSMGYFGATGLRWYSVTDEIARLLLAEARFDRIAVETRQDRVHLVIVGCGSLGEAIAVEALLTCWRTALLPPRITILDRDIDLARARMKQRFPAWFDQDDGTALPEASRPILDFRICDAELIDLDAASNLQDLKTGVTGWVFATADDALNLRASSIVHRAISMLKIDPSPLYVRVPSGHAVEPNDLVAHPISLAHTFGAIDDVIRRAPLLKSDPDAFARQLHAAYAQASIEMGLASTSENWDDLSEAKREANRSLFRTAVMKIEDFGGEAQPPFNNLPAIHPQICNDLKRVDSVLDYAVISRETTPHDWVKPGESLNDADVAIATQLRDVAITEHNRWVVERALAHFRPTGKPDHPFRDDVRRYHDNMVDWYDLPSGDVRRFDVVLLRALLSNSQGTAKTIVRASRARSLFMSIGPDGTLGRAFVMAEGAPKHVDVTELRVYLSAVAEPFEFERTRQKALEQLLDHLDPEQHILPRRLVIVFYRSPGPQTLAVANAVAEALKDRFGSSLAIEASWNWSTAPLRMVGVFGHRNLEGLASSIDLTERFRQVFMHMNVHGRVSKLLCGYATGADQLAVSAWNSLNLPHPHLLFPYVTDDSDGRQTYMTDHPDRADADQTFDPVHLKAIGLPERLTNGQGHEQQAQSLLDRCDALIAVADTTREILPGGTLDTLCKAEAAGVPVTKIGDGRGGAS